MLCLGESAWEIGVIHAADPAGNCRLLLDACHDGSSRPSVASSRDTDERPPPLFPPPPPPPHPPRRADIPAEDSEQARLWALVGELSEQLAKNRELAARLKNQVATIKNQAAHAQGGFPLRRFNTDVDRDTYDAELTRLNTTIGEENAVLVHENKQIAGLVREYEATMEVVMARFRQSALDTQERELAIARAYEQELLVRDERLHTSMLAGALSSYSTAARISALLRSALRAEQGEPDPDSEQESEHVFDANDSLERECELARVQRENAELRRMLGRPLPDFAYAPPPPPPMPPSPSPSPPRRLPALMRRFPAPEALRTAGLGVYSAFAGSGGAMGVGMLSPGADASFSADAFWREQERSNENREALLS